MKNENEIIETIQERLHNMVWEMKNRVCPPPEPYCEMAPEDYVKHLNNIEECLTTLLWVLKD